MSNCKHETSVVTCTIESLGLTQMICTWQCQKPFWMLQTGLTTKEIQNEEAAKMITGISSNTNESAGRIRIEPQPELVKNSEGAWVCDEKAFMDNDAMSEYLFEEIYIEGLGNSPDYECEPLLVDGVWYWEPWVLEDSSNNG